MAESDISPAIRDFIAQHIDSVLQLEVLLLLHAQRRQSYTPEQIAGELRIDPTWASAQLARLSAMGILISITQSNVTSYQYQPARKELDDAVIGLAEEYARRRVSVVSLIFQKPTDALRNFADAFRLRKDKDKSDG